MNTLRRSTTLPLATLGLLVACGGNGPTPPPQGVTVSGSVRDRVAEPISGATVLVGKSSATSSSDGTFSIPGVVTPYDITAVLPAQNTALIYKGLTRSDPVLLYPDVTGAERTATISGTAPPASGSATVVLFVSNGRELYVIFGRGALYWEEKNASSNAFTYTVPAQAGVTFTVAARAVDGSSRSSSFFRGGISGNTSNVSVPLAAAPQLASPANGASGVDTTIPFSWTQGQGTGVNVFKVWPGNSTSPTYFVFTTGADAKIPDLAAEGMGLPAGASYYWQVYRISPVASVDDAAAEGYRRLITDLDRGDVGETISERFGFTTKTATGTAVAASATASSAAAAEEGQRRGLVMKAPILAGPR